MGVPSKCRSAAAIDSTSLCFPIASVLVCVTHSCEVCFELCAFQGRKLADTSM